MLKLARAASITLGILVLTSCGPTDNGGCTVTLHTSMDDRTTFQMAFVNAADHATICVAPGTYHFTDPIALASLNGVTFRGLGATPGDVVLDFQTMSMGERGVSFTSMTNVSVSNMTILDATHDDLYFQHCTGVSVSHVVAGWVHRMQHGAYAIYPVESMNVRIDHCEAYGSADAGLYVGQTTNCVVSNNLVHDNVAGLEIENSTNCEVFGNTTHDNTAGILVFELPGLLAHGMRTSVHDNVSMNNNTTNFAAGGIVQYVPEGLGVMIMGAHETEVQHNTVTGNHTAGILLVSYATAVLAGAPASTDAMYDGWLRHSYVHDNMVSNNGGSPNAAVTAASGLGPGSYDIVWDGQTGPMDTPPQLCVSNGGTFVSVHLATDPTMQSHMTGIPMAAASCMAPVIPPVVF